MFIVLSTAGVLLYIIMINTSHSSVHFLKNPPLDGRGIARHYSHLSPALQSAGCPFILCSSSLYFSTMSTFIFYALAVTTTVSALIVTILNAIAYATWQSLPSGTPDSELTPLSLSVFSCVLLLALTLLLHKDVRGDHQWSEWKICLFFFTGGYLILAAALSSGIMTTNELPSGLWISRSIFWALSIFTQGLFYGYLLMKMVQTKPETTWPSAYSQSDFRGIIAMPQTVQTVQSISPRTDGLDIRTSSLRKFPRRSSRYSGRTLCLQNTDEVKHNSFDTTSSTISSPAPSPTKDRTPDTFAERDPRLLRGHGSIRSMPSLRHERVQQSLDGLVQSSPMGSPTESTFQLDSSSASTVTLADREHNIHPLFRSTSPSPPPTPTRGTTVKASPSAGQTITKSTLTRMRSNRSLRSPSPLPESEESPPDVTFIHVGRLYRSPSITHRPSYDLNESPDEK